MPRSPTEPRLSSALVRELRAIVGEDAVLLDPDRLVVYESDGLTQYRHPPSAVLLPGSTEEVCAVLRALHRAEVPFVPRGAGTGLSGGALAIGGAVVVGLARMNRILEVDPENRRARVQPGVINAHLTRATLPHGLIYAPDPSSQSACTLGGNVAENSGGPHCLKYGVTNRYVTGLTVVLPSGEVVRLGGAGSGADGGLDLVGLFVGSEGCLGVATEIEVALIPAPEGVRTLLAIFDSMEDAGRAVTDIMARGLLPAALEIIDAAAIRAVESSVFAGGYPTDAGAALVVEFDGVDAGLDEELERAAACCREAGSREVRTASDEEERSALWRGRKKAFGTMGRLAPDLLVQDATVPRTRLPEVLARIGEIGARYELLVANVFHAGDGNLHPNLLFDRRDPDEVRRVEAASEEIMQVCIDAGGTITGEHGVGVDKRRYMPRIYTDDVLRAMGEVRAAFDPSGRCNPGKVLPDGYGPAFGLGGDVGSGREAASEPDEAAIADGREWRRMTEIRTASALPVLDRLADVVGVGAVERVSGRAVAYPRTDDEVAALMGVAAEAGWRVLPGGRSGGTATRDTVLHASRGSKETASADSAPLLVIATDAMDALLEHEPGDLVVRARSGLSLSRLQEAVADAGQWLAVDPPGDPGLTVGELVARGDAGPLRAGYGRPRDQVLGLTLVDGGGRVLRLGGRVVKNVAGFDLVRFATGSRGALGLITEVTFRLYPRPEVDRTHVWNCETEEEGWRLGRRLATLPLPVAAAELAAGDWDPALIPHCGNEPSQTNNRILILIRVHGSAAAVERMSRQLASEGGAPDRVLSGPESAACWASLARNLGSATGPVSIPTLPSRGREVVAAFEGLGVRRFAVHLLDGVVRMVPETPADYEEAARLRDGARGETPAGPTASGRGTSTKRETGDGSDVRDGEPLVALRDGLVRTFDPAGILPGAWRWRWTRPDASIREAT